MGFAVKMDENDAASIASDLRLTESKDFADCLVGVLFPLADERTSCKLFKMLVTEYMEERELYKKNRDDYFNQKLGNTESVIVKFSPPEAG